MPSPTEGKGIEAVGRFFMCSIRYKKTFNLFGKDRCMEFYLELDQLKHKFPPDILVRITSFLFYKHLTPEEKKKHIKVRVYIIQKQEGQRVKASSEVSREELDFIEKRLEVLPKLMEGLKSGSYAKLLEMCVEDLVAKKLSEIEHALENSEYILKEVERFEAIGYDRGLTLTMSEQEYDIVSVYIILYTPKGLYQLLLYLSSDLSNEKIFGMQFYWKEEDLPKS